MEKQKKCKLQLRLKAFDRKSLQKFHSAVSILAKTKNVHFSSIGLPIKRKRITLLRSPHVNKKAKDQFEIRYYNNLIVLSGNPHVLPLLQPLISTMPSDLAVKLLYKY